KDATSSLVNVSTKLMSGEHQVKESSNDEELPSTGETASNLGMAGLGMMSILGLVQLKRKKSKTI
ncbi:LPXTG cell wall anchor domain-containing protein, partial [Streptococcus danieliae]